MATHAHAVLVTMNPIALLFANDAREITSGNDETPGFGVVVLTAEVLVDVGLALQPGKQEGAIWGACLRGEPEVSFRGTVRPQCASCSLCSDC